MTKPIAYVALAFGSPGCSPSAPTAYAIYQRRDIVEAVKGQFYDDPAGEWKALKDLGVRKLWAHVKRHGLSVISWELDCGKEGEVLNFMGLTEAEFAEYEARED